MTAVSYSGSKSWSSGMKIDGPLSGVIFIPADLDMIRDSLMSFKLK